MSRPAAGALAEIVYEDLQPQAHEDEGLDWPLLRFLMAAVSGLDVFYRLVSDTTEGPGYSALVDPDRLLAEFPQFLPWLAQWVGAHPYLVGLSDVERAALIRDTPNFYRGTPGAIKRAAASACSGPNPRVLLVERSPDATSFTVVTHVDETPDPAAVVAAVERQRPWGLLAVFRVDGGWTIAEAEAFYTGQTIASLEADFASILAFESHLSLGLIAELEITFAGLAISDLEQRFATIHDLETEGV